MVFLEYGAIPAWRGMEGEAAEPQREGGGSSDPGKVGQQSRKLC